MFSEEDAEVVSHAQGPTVVSILVTDRVPETEVQFRILKIKTREIKVFINFLHYFFKGSTPGEG